MNELTIEWRHIQWLAQLEGQSPLQIEYAREKFFKENNNEKDEKDEDEDKEAQDRQV